ncbi:hypothetical protein [Nitrosomonas communis]|uniref:hypothetical protein n=1 Tax=Nitrosomonas communis TaxID=44574 RepID=UPI003D264F67
MAGNLWLRPGNSHSANNPLAFLNDSLDKLDGNGLALLRADSGCSESPFPDDLDRHGMHYLIALRLNHGHCRERWQKKQAGGHWMMA